MMKLILMVGTISAAFMDRSRLRRLQDCSTSTFTAVDYTASGGYTALDYWQQDGGGSETVSPALPDLISTSLTSTCSITSCQAVKALTNSICAPPTAGAPMTGSLSGSTVTLTIDTTAKSTLAYYCLECMDNQGTPVAHYSEPFPMQVFVCSDYVTLTNPAASYPFVVPTTPAGSDTAVLSGSAYAATSDGTNCVLTFALKTVSPDALYSGTFLGTFDTAVGDIVVDTNTVDDQDLYVTVTAGQAGSYTGSITSFNIVNTCTGTYTITEGSSTSPTSVTFGDGSVGFTLPTYTSSHPQCAVGTLALSADGSTSASPANL